MEYTKEYKKKVFDSLPADLQEAILSVDTAEKLSEIRERHSLMLDQAGELGDELGLFMLGLTKQDNFVMNLSKRLNVPIEKAIQISVDINKEILAPVRHSLQSIQSRPFSPPPTNPPPPPKPASVSPIEKAGGFTVEKPVAPPPPRYNEASLRREDVLADLENIGHLKPENAESFVEHLIDKPAPAPAPEPPEAPTPPPPPPKPEEPKPEQKKYGVDPYREPI